ncbi:metallophosphoesterase family protein [Ramlibacter solisilvae]|uniref:Metallophosphoesterase n=1 Tax=Ramlibacter tataouinensis TaxID=94132 RepID=A0A127JSF6_9BURK|nr:metallophosphoesterase family protein [Ramlibacter tataouinensis]AMO22906.1 metallophosphoesterase [Ramlibacter tataouinensis]
MKLALLSDLHANLQALEACLADARARGATHYAFLGDLVGYGADPAPVLDIVMTLAQQGAWVVKGNHDDAAVNPQPGSQRADQVGGRWSHGRLGRQHRAFLADLPLVVRHGKLLLVHASAVEPERWTYITRPAEATESMTAAQAQQATHVFCGHVHEQRLFYTGAAGRTMAFEPTPGVALPVPAHRQWLATIGSVGQPRDGNADAMYAMLDVAALQLTFLRVPYDWRAAATAIVHAGLPAFNAVRLGIGQ